MGRFKTHRRNHKSRRTKKSKHQKKRNSMKKNKKTTYKHNINRLFYGGFTQPQIKTAFALYKCFLEHCINKTPITTEMFGGSLAERLEEAKKKKADADRDARAEARSGPPAESSSTQPSKPKTKKGRKLDETPSAPASATATATASATATATATASTIPPTMGFRLKLGKPGYTEKYVLEFTTDQLKELLQMYLDWKKSEGKESKLNSDFAVKVKNLTGTDIDTHTYKNLHDIVIKYRGQDFVIPNEYDDAVKGEIIKNVENFVTNPGAAISLTTAIAGGTGLTAAFKAAATPSGIEQGWNMVKDVGTGIKSVLYGGLDVKAAAFASVVDTTTPLLQMILGFTKDMIELRKVTQADLDHAIALAKLNMEEKKIKDDMMLTRYAITVSMASTENTRDIILETHRSEFEAQLKILEGLLDTLKTNRNAQNETVMGLIKNLDGLEPEYKAQLMNGILEYLNTINSDHTVESQILDTLMSCNETSSAIFSKLMQFQTDATKSVLQLAATEREAAAPLVAPPVAPPVAPLVAPPVAPLGVEDEQNAAESEDADEQNADVEPVGQMGGAFTMVDSMRKLINSKLGRVGVRSNMFAQASSANMMSQQVEILRAVSILINGTYKDPIFNAASISVKDEKSVLMDTNTTNEAQTRLIDLASEYCDYLQLKDEAILDGIIGPLRDFKIYNESLAGDYLFHTLLYLNMFSPNTSLSHTAKFIKDNFKLYQ